ncbi:hypothetical protein J7J84_07690 [bacterium]|nr:hypothetical protein [bacterium]
MSLAITSAIILLLFLAESTCGTKPSYLIGYFVESAKNAVNRRPSALARQATVLVAALNDYYRVHSEYPPYLLGGNPTKEWEETGFHDPLLDCGFLKSYPESSAYEWSPLTMSKVEPRGIRYVRNVVSMPNDPVVEFMREHFKPMIRYEYKQLLSGQPGSSLAGHETGTQILLRRGILEETLESTRYFCAGGVDRLEWYRNGEASLQIHALKYTVFMLISKFSGELYFLADNPDGQFGYQRGDFIESIEGTAKEAWLWFYGFVSDGDSPEEMPGLDLVDNDDGLIQPDGIPDGIVVLYKLKEGEVIEVVKKYD